MDTTHVAAYQIVVVGLTQSQRVWRRSIAVLLEILSVRACRPLLGCSWPEATAAVVVVRSEATLAALVTFLLTRHCFTTAHHLT